MTYELFVRQLDGCTYMPGGYNCTCASEAMWLYRASQGKIRTTSCAVRTETGDRSGGTNLRQMVLVSAKHNIAGGTLYQPISFDTLAALVETGRYGSHLNISYAPFVGTKYDRFHGGFRGNHDIYLSRKGAIAGTLRVGDPGATGFVDIPKSLLKTAAGRLDLGNGVTLNAEFGGGKAYAYVTPKDPIGAAPTVNVVVTIATALWNDSTKRWVYNGASALPVGTRLTVRGARYTKGGVVCYPVNGPTKYAGYFVPTSHVRLT